MMVTCPKKCPACRRSIIWTERRVDARSVSRFYRLDTLVAIEWFGEVLCRSCVED